MGARNELYDLLLDYANLQIEVERVLLGLNWTLCKAGSIGIAETTGTGSWRKESPRPLAGRSLAELSLWLRKWDRQQASIGLAAINAAVNSEADMVYREGALFRGNRALANALEWFLPRIRDHRIAVIAEQNPYAEQSQRLDMTWLPTSNGALHPACEVMLGKAEWVFVNGQSIADKTLPRVLELVGNAVVVLYGPQVPWLEEWRDFGVHYLVGGQLDCHDTLYEVIAEGGDIHAIPQAISYRVCDLNTPSVLKLPLNESPRAVLL